MLEEDDSINSEIRFITIELMKIAAQKGITFEEASREFLKNAVFLKRLIEITESTDQISRVISSRFPLQPASREQKPGDAPQDKRPKSKTRKN